MWKLWIFLCVSFLSLDCISCGHLGATLVGPPAPGTVIQGPGSKTSLVGPDGSHVSSGVAGGTVIAPPIPGGVVSHSVSPGYIANSGPAVFSAVAHSGAGLSSYAEPYDDGSYKGDYNEGFYDDGSYKEHY